LGSQVEERVESQDGNLKTNLYPLEQVVVPIVWSEKDEIEYRTESKRINLCTQMLENAFHSMDYIAHDRLGAGRVVLSKRYQYVLGQVSHLEHAHGYIVKMYSLMAFLPAKVV
jgi:hypothetical protein